MSVPTEKKLLKTFASWTWNKLENVGLLLYSFLGDSFSFSSCLIILQAQSKRQRWR